MHDIRIVLMVDSVVIENVQFDCSDLVVSVRKQDASRVSVVFSRDDDGVPNDSLLRGGAGYKDAHTFVWRNMPVTSPPAKPGRRGDWCTLLDGTQRFLLKEIEEANFASHKPPE